MKKILIIEDSQDILENVAEILSLSHYTVYTAADGKQGIELAMLHTPDLIICDIMMPELDGYGVLHVIQKNPVLQQIPFIFLTARTEMSELRKAMSLGADDYITKPFDATELLKAIEGRLHKAELMKQKRSDLFPDGFDAGTSTNSEKTLHHFVEGRNVDKYRKRQRIFTEGNHPIRVYFVQKGKVKIFKTNDEGKEFITRVISEGEFFGYVSMFEQTIYKESAEALEDCAIAAIPKKDFEELVQSNPEVCRTFYRLLANDVTDKEEQLIHIAYNSLRKKVAGALLSVMKTFHDAPGEFNITLSRENLAAIAGTATESLIRTLTDFRSEKLIDIREGKITILNSNKLQSMVN
jgi:DNA-binding response OmpR family regulator